MKNFLKIYKNNQISNLELIKVSSKNSKKKKFNFESVEKLSLNIFKQLIEVLSTKHNLKMNEEFWKTFLYPWVFMYVSITLDRYILVKNNFHLKVGFKNKIDLSKILYEDSELHHKKFSNDCVTNFNYCNLVFNIIKKNSFSFYNYPRFKNKTQTLNKKNFLLKLYNFLPFSNFVIRAFNIKSFFLNIFTYKSLLFPNMKQYQTIKLDLEFRKKIKIKFKKNYELNKILKKTLPYLVPVSFVENFNNIKKNIDIYYPQKVKNIYSDSSIIVQDATRLWAAIRRTCGAKLKIFQHGGAYTDKINSSVYLEHEISDTHLVFAKKYKKKEKQYTDKIFLRIKNSNKPTNDKILMPITFVSNFNKHYEFPRSSDYIFYYREIFNFLENINKEISDKLVLRLMPNTKKKNFFIKILNKNFPHIKYEIPNKNINESLKNYSFFIGSINSTTILQAMLSGIPLIIFMNKDYFMPSNNFKKCYDLLKKNHIMFDNGKSAANFLNFEFNSKKSWYSAGGKNARKHFIKNILYKDFKL